MSIQVAIVDGPIPRAGATGSSAATTAGGIGAQIRFEGIVRATEAGETLAGLVYETYDPMAERSMRTLAAEAIELFEIETVHVVHSRGFVPVGETSLLVVVGSRHRAPGLAAMAWYIDRLKQVVPIWKHLRYPDGRTQAARGAVVDPPGRDSRQA